MTKICQINVSYIHIHFPTDSLRCTVKQQSFMKKMSWSFSEETLKVCLKLKKKSKSLELQTCTKLH